jgi:adenylate kinase family enzyme
MNVKRNKQKTNSSGNITTLTIKRKIKEMTDKLLKKLNKNMLGSKIYPDDLVNFWVDRMTDDLCLEIQQSKLTIVDEMPRIRKLWENSNTKVTDEKWELMKITGELTGFFK